MSTVERYRKRYGEDDKPWDIGRPDGNLIRLVMDRLIRPCRALEIGSGTGNDAIWLAERGFHVTGCDSSEIAVGQAVIKAEEAAVDCRFLTADFLDDPIPGAPFRFIFDRGCFHSFDEPDERESFAGRVAGHLEEGGLWFSMVGSTDETSEGSGPPRRSARDVTEAVETHFEILSIVAGFLASNRPDPPKAWVCLMRKR